jgi:hypothetical protein
MVSVGIFSFEWGGGGGQEMICVLETKQVSPRSWMSGHGKYKPIVEINEEHHIFTVEFQHYVLCTLISQWYI